MSSPPPTTDGGIAGTTCRRWLARRTTVGPQPWKSPKPRLASRRAQSGVCLRNPAVRQLRSGPNGRTLVGDSESRPNPLLCLLSDVLARAMASVEPISGVCMQVIYVYVHPCEPSGKRLALVAEFDRPESDRSDAARRRRDSRKDHRSISGRLSWPATSGSRRASASRTSSQPPPCGC